MNASGFRVDTLLFLELEGSCTCNDVRKEPKRGGGGHLRLLPAITTHTAVSSHHNALPLLFTFSTCPILYILKIIRLKSRSFHKISSFKNKPSSQSTANDYLQTCQWSRLKCLMVTYARSRPSLSASRLWLYAWTAVDYQSWPLAMCTYT